MQRHRHNDVESVPAQPFIIQGSMKPARYKMSQMKLARVFKFVNNLANDTATAVCGHSCVEVNRAMSTVGTCKCARDGTLEGFRACLTKWRHDASDPCLAVTTRSEEHTSELQSQS